MAKIEIVKPIIIEIDGMTYTLEFNRNSVVAAERAGFVADQIAEKPMTMLPLLFFAAFRKNQPNISREETDRILFDVLGGLSKEVVERLVKLYTEPTKTLFRTEDDGEQPKNAKISL